MKKVFLRVSALFAFVCFCCTNIALVVSQNGKISSNLNLADIESCEAACEKFPDENNGDCQGSPDGGWCAKSTFFHDCKR
jgi:hypothetical protein